jgi:hemerythrin-like domain-containing protein
MTQARIPTDILKEEHQAVLTKLTILEEAIHNLDSRAKVSPSLEELTSFFSTAFWVHFDKEEHALFPEFDGVMPRGMGPLAAMIEEHEVIRKTQGILHQAISTNLDGNDDVETGGSITSNGDHFIGFLRDHIRKEDSLLVQMAETYLSPSQNDKVVKLFSEIENSAN